MRSVTLLLLLATAVLAQNKTRLGGGKPRYRMRRNYALPEGTKEAENPASRKGRVEKFQVFFFDVDGNGKFNDLGVDGWSLPKMPYLLPLEEKVVIGRSVVTWTVEADGSMVHWSKQPIPVERGQEKTLVEFNQWRFMNGLPGVTVSKELSEACRKHCLYMEKNGMTHYEKEGNSGYTPEGAEAGRRSCLSEMGPRLSVLSFYASFYHRLPLIHPETRAIGIGVSKRYTTVDGLTDRKHRAWRYPIIIPAPNSWFQPTLFAPEQPRAYPAELKPGFPISLTFDRGTITEARGELRLGGPKGAEVRTLVSSPEHPANKKRPDNRMSILVLPRTPLLPRKKYWVKVTYKLDGKEKQHEWLFNTGRPGPVLTMR